MKVSPQWRHEVLKGSLPVQIAVSPSRPHGTSGFSPLAAGGGLYHTLRVFCGEQDVLQRHETTGYPRDTESFIPGRSRFCAGGFWRTVGLHEESCVSHRIWNLILGCFRELAHMVGFPYATDAALWGCNEWKSGCLLKFSGPRNVSEIGHQNWELVNSVCSCEPSSCRHLQRFWGASGDFWQDQWTRLYLAFEGHDAALFFFGEKYQLNFVSLKNTTNRLSLRDVFTFGTISQW